MWYAISTNFNVKSSPNAVTIRAVDKVLLWRRAVGNVLTQVPVCTDAWNNDDADRMCRSVNASFTYVQQTFFCYARFQSLIDMRQPFQQ